MSVTAVKIWNMGFCENQLRVLQSQNRNQGSRLRGCTSTSINSDEEVAFGYIYEDA